MKQRLVCVYVLAGLVAAGCATPGEKPQGLPEECSPETLRVMREKLGLEPGNRGGMVVNAGALPSNSRENTIDMKVCTVASTIIPATYSQIPPQTMIFGEMVVGKERVHVHYRTARLPDGTRIPVCMVLGVDERSGVLKEPGKEPGTYRMQRSDMYTVVRRFERPY